ncbi:MAG: HEAT repeat domain-containing protein [Thermoguttaceae bacterium]|jgi:HEAT repeat protein
MAVTAALLPAATRSAPPPSLVKELIPADMPAEVRRHVEQLYSRSDKECLAAIGSLSEMGPAAAPAAPFLASMLDGHFSTPSANMAAAALMRIGKEAFDAVAATASSTGAEARCRAVLVLARIDGPRAAPVIFELFETGLGGDPQLGALRLIGEPAREHVFQAARSSDAVKRRAAMQAVLAFASVHPSYHDIGGPGADPGGRGWRHTQAVADLLLEALGDRDAEVRFVAARSLAHIAHCSDKRLPLSETLRAALKDENPRVRSAAVEAAVRADELDQTKYEALAPLVGDVDQDVRIEAVAAIGLLPGQRERAVPLLMKLLTDDSAAARERAALTLGKMRVVEAEPSLLKALEDPTRPVRVAAALALGRCGGKDGIEALIRVTKTDDVLLTFEAARALCERCLDLRGVHWSNRLTYRMTGSEAPWTTRSALLPLPASLRDSFPADSVRDCMVELLAGPNRDLHTPAAEALIEGSLGMKVPDSVLLAAFRSPAHNAQLVALLHMEQMRSVPDQRFLEPLRRLTRTPLDQLALPILVRMRDTETVLFRCERILKHDSSKIASGAPGILAALGEPGLDLLLKHLGDPRADVRETVVTALTPQIDHPRVQAFVAAALNGKDDHLRRGAEQLTALTEKKVAPPPTPQSQWRAAILSGGNGGRAHAKQVDDKAVEIMKGLLQDTDSEVRVTAAAVLGEAQGAPAAVAILTAALKDQSPPVRAQASESLGRLGDRRATAALLSAMNDSEEAVREAAAEALGRLGNPAALGPLVKALGSRDAGVRRAAAQSLGRLEDARALDALRGALRDDPHWRVRQAAAAALGRAPANFHVPLLIDALGDEHWAVCRAAHESLLSITHEKLQPDPEVWRAWWEKTRSAQDGTDSTSQ